MAFVRRQPGQRTQLVDWMDSGSTVVPAVANPVDFNFIANGTVFPLLAQSNMRIYNVGARIVTFDTSLKLSVRAIAVFLAFFSDPAGTQAIVDGQGQPVRLVLAAEAFTGLGVNLGSATGVPIESEGDPLLEIAANVLLAGIAQTSVSVQLQARADVQSNDTVNPHSATLVASGLLDFQV